MYATSWWMYLRRLRASARGIRWEWNGDETDIQDTTLGFTMECAQTTYSTAVITSNRYSRNHSSCILRVIVINIKSLIDILYTNRYTSLLDREQTAVISLLEYRSLRIPCIFALTGNCMTSEYRNIRSRKCPINRHVIQRTVPR